MDMKKTIFYFFGFFIFQAGCASPKEKKQPDNYSIRVAQEIIRSQFCTLDKVKGKDKRVFPGELDNSLYTYNILYKFSNSNNREIIYSNIIDNLKKLNINTNIVTKQRLFNASKENVGNDVKFNICNSHHKIIVNPSNTSKKSSGVLVISNAIVLENDMNMYYYEFGDAKTSLVAGFSIIKIQDGQCYPLYECIITNY